MEVNRRNFIKTSGMVAAGAVILPPFVQSCQNAQISNTVKSYLDHFEVSTEMLQKVIAEAMSKGGDYADLFFEHKISNNLGLEDGNVIAQLLNETDYQVIAVDNSLERIHALQKNMTAVFFSRASPFITSHRQNFLIKNILPI